MCGRCVCSRQVRKRVWGALCAVDRDGWDARCHAACVALRLASRCVVCCSVARHGPGAGAVCMGLFFAAALACLRTPKDVPKTKKD